MEVSGLSNQQRHRKAGESVGMGRKGAECGFELILRFDRANHRRHFRDRLRERHNRVPTKEGAGGEMEASVTEVVAKRQKRKEDLS